MHRRLFSYPKDASYWNPMECGVYVCIIFHGRGVRKGFDRILFCFDPRGGSCKRYCT